MSLWDSLDDLGSSLTNVADQVVSSAGDLVAARIDSQVSKTQDQTVVRSANKLPVQDPNAWQKWVLGGLAAVAVLALIVVVSRR